MSWNGYIDTLKQNCGPDASSACIIALDGGAPWTSTANPSCINIETSEAVEIARAMKNKDIVTFQQKGVKIAGIKYQFLKDDEDGKVIYAKKRGEGGIAMQATRTAILITKYDEGSQPGPVNKGTGVVAEYLVSQSM